MAELCLFVSLLLLLKEKKELRLPIIKIWQQMVSLVGENEQSKLIYPEKYGQLWS